MVELAKQPIRCFQHLKKKCQKDDLTSFFFLNTSNSTYHSLCIFDNPTYMLDSFFGSKDFSTSDFNLLKRNGFKTLCNLLTKESSPRQLYIGKRGKIINRIEQLFDPVLDGLFTFMFFKEILASKFEIF